MPEVQGTVKAISKSGKGIILAEYDDQWFNKGKDFQGAWPAQRGEGFTLTYEQTYDADGKTKFWVIEAWPTSGGKPAPQAAPSGPRPTDGPKPTAAPEPSGPVPTPPDRENYIHFAVCLKAAQEWVLRRYRHGDINRTEGQVLYVADLYYNDGLNLIGGHAPANAVSPVEEPVGGDPGPTEEPA